MISKILAIINKVKDNKADELLEVINVNTKLREDCGFDSLDLAELTVRVEREFGIDIFANGNINTVREILEQIK